MHGSGFSRAILCFVQGVAIVLSAEGRQDRPLPVKMPYIVPEREPVNRNQRIGSPVFIRATRSIKVMTDEAHRSRRNIVAVYIGLPVVDAGQDKVVIEKILSKRAKPENLALSSDGGTLWVEYIDVESGFEDEIQMTFSCEIYERKAQLSGVKPYKTDAQPFKLYTRKPFYRGIKLATDKDKGFELLREAGISTDMGVLDQAKAIYDYLHRELAYGQPGRIVGGTRANCATYAAMFFNLCQRTGIPARRCAGFVFSPSKEDEQATSVSGHNWAEFYVEGIGWIPVDPTMGDKADVRKQYYFGNIDNGRLCVSKTAFSWHLPLRYKNPENHKWVFTSDASEFKPFKHPQAIQGAYLFQHALDEKPVKIKTSDPYGLSLTISERKGNISKSLNMADFSIASEDEQDGISEGTP